MELNKLSIAEASAQMNAGKLTAVQLAEACLARAAPQRLARHTRGHQGHY